MVAGNLDAARQNFQVNTRKPHRFPKVPSAVSSRKGWFETAERRQARIARASRDPAPASYFGGCNPGLLAHRSSSSSTLSWLGRLGGLDSFGLRDGLGCLSIDASVSFDSTPPQMKPQ